MASLTSLFKKKKTPDAVVGQLKRDLVELPAVAAGDDARALEKLQEDIAKRVDQMKQFIYGDPEKPEEPPLPANIELLAQCMEEEEIMPAMLFNLKAVDFETRKAVAMVFVYLLRHDVHGFGSRYLPLHTSLLAQLVDGYNSPEVALNCGTMLRECVRLSPALHEALLYGPDGGLSKPLRDLFETHVHNPNFEVSSDAFETLSVTVTTNKPVVFRLLNPEGDAASQARYADFFTLYNRLLTSDNYVLKRQSLKLLSEFLLDRENFAIMMRYIGERANLKVIMTLLRHKQPNIQFEAFHVFKVFVANPQKPADIADILAANKAKAIAFLQTFQNEKDDEQFTEEKAMLIDTLSRLPNVTLTPTLTPSTAGEDGGAASGGHAHAVSGFAADAAAVAGLGTGEGGGAPAAGGAGGLVAAAHE